MFASRRRSKNFVHELVLSAGERAIMTALRPGRPLLAAILRACGFGDASIPMIADISIARWIKVEMPFFRAQTAEQ